MKKYTTLLLAFILILGLSGCAEKEYKLPWDEFCYLAEQPYEAVELEPREKKYIIGLLNGFSWTEGLPDSESDYFFYPQAQKVGYNSTEGIFTDYTNERHATVTDDARKDINHMLGVN